MLSWNTPASGREDGKQIAEKADTEDNFVVSRRKV